jgi:membrane fusion protein (multidrug efflux system)
MVTATQPETTHGRRVRRSVGMFGTILLALLLAGGLTVLLLALAGVFAPKVPSHLSAPAEVARTELPLAEVRSIRRGRSETAVGTVRAVHEAAVASRLLARVTEVHVKAGQPVLAGDLLVRLDDSDLQARLRQAEAAVIAAREEKQKAERDYARGRELSPGGGISKEDLDHREAARRTTAADLERAEHLVAEAKVVLDYATIRSPITGTVVDKRVEAGDTVSPGQVLVTLYNPKRMQMVVTVPESLASRLKVGQKVAGRLEALNHECEATVSEIVPEAQAASRSFAVKVTGPCPPGVYTGMFGRIFIPLDDEEVVVVPAAAVVRVGQLDMVRVWQDGRTERRSVQLGRRFDQDYEVLSGLKPGEKVVLEKGREGPTP